MPITRTSQVDDDGSGTTGTIWNNAWKQELYNQIDALAGTAGVAWTPTDASGAGLVFAVTMAYYVRIGQLVGVWAQFGYPATASAAPATIGGLPFTAQASSGFYTTYGIPQQFHISGATSNILVLNPANGAQRTNADVSGALLVFAGVYLV